jgi:hypothetical protein
VSKVAAANAPQLDIKKHIMYRLTEIGWGMKKGFRAGIKGAKMYRNICNVGNGGRSAKTAGADNKMESKFEEPGLS